MFMVLGIIIHYFELNSKTFTATSMFRVLGFKIHYFELNSKNLRD